MKILNVLLILLLPGLIFSQTNKISTIDRISSICEINKGDLICIIFLNVGECDKCYNNTLRISQFLLDSVDSFHIKLVLGVNVKRDKDLHGLKELNSWYKPAITKSNEIKTEYGLGRMDSFLLLDHIGVELYRINLIDLEKNFNTEIQELIKITREHLKINNAN